MSLIVENQTSITRPLFLEWRKSNHSASYKKTIRFFTLLMVVLFAALVL